MTGIPATMEVTGNRAFGGEILEEELRLGNGVWVQGKYPCKVN